MAPLIPEKLIVLPVPIPILRPAMSSCMTDFLFWYHEIVFIIDTPSLMMIQQVLAQWDV